MRDQRESGKEGMLKDNSVLASKNLSEVGKVPTAIATIRSVSEVSRGGKTDASRAGGPAEEALVSRTLRLR